MSSVGVDFDGVIHAYTKGWQDGVIYDEPMPGAFDAIRQLQAAGYGVFVHTSRSDVKAVADWIWAHSQIGVTTFADESSLPAFWDDTTLLLVTNRKLGAVAYIDDRAIRFIDWKQALAELERVEAVHGFAARLATVSLADLEAIHGYARHHDVDDDPSMQRIAALLSSGRQA